MKIVLFFVVMLSGAGAKAESDTVWVKDMWEMNETQVLNVRFSPNDSTVYVLGLEGIYAFETENGKFKKKFNDVNSLHQFRNFEIFDNGKKLFTISNSGIAGIWDTSIGDTIKTIPEFWGFDFDISDVNKKLYLDNSGSIKIYNIETMNLDTIINKGIGSEGVKVSKDGRYIAIECRTTSSWWITIYDAITYNTINTYSHPDNITDMKFSKDTRYLASCGWKNTLILWDLVNQKVLDTLRSENIGADLFALTFSPDSKYLIFSDPSIEPIYRYYYEIGIKKFVKKDQNAYSRLETSNDSKYILGNGGRYVCLQRTFWNPNSIPGRDEEIEPINISPNPVTGNSVLTINIPKVDYYNLTISDYSGSKSYTETDKYLDARQYLINWNTSQLATGIYFCKISSKSFKKTIKIILVK